jgi:Protein of unknown function (DUF3795)
MTGDARRLAEGDTMIGYCGLDCDLCEAFIATKNNDDALRAKVAAEWAKLENAPIKPEHINCTGCRSAGVKTYYCDQLCDIRKCATKKSISTCAQCSDYPCSTLDLILKTAPQAKRALDALRKK